MFRVFWVKDDFDLYATGGNNVTYRCEEPGCPEPHVWFSDQFVKGLPRFLKHVSGRRLEWDPFKVFEVGVPTPACTTKAPFGRGR